MVRFAASVFKSISYLLLISFVFLGQEVITYFQLPKLNNMGVCDICTTHTCHPCQVMYPLRHVIVKHLKHIRCNTTNVIPVCETAVYFISMALAVCRDRSTTTDRVGEG